MLQARPGTSYQSTSSQYVPSQPQSPSVDTITLHHIQETSIKRLSTLDYLRKVHEGRVYWFNTLLLSKSDLHRTSKSDSRKIARRATNYLLLGLSLTNIIDLYSSNPTEYIKTFNALLSEFESFQQSHRPEGISSSSLSRGRLPHMFKRATISGSKSRRASSAADIGLPMGNEGDISSAIGNGAQLSTATPTPILFPVSESDLHPGEEYTYLLTPSLPFDPDINETFATLCDVLIECYSKLITLITSPRETGPLFAELFTKADSKVKKLILQGVMKELEDRSRNGIKNELTGIGNVISNGLM
ncbi:hypothetical protein HI914_07239 [Erysiphe necator]|uniref:Uncharacterized protein n=1 Tax=Uncinula necator TaxID=52586 RepID=A0A0B1P064_UNCNE|nr:hypothetical protein HI914_07239 [Erysiphe necator]KHJ31633.1 hypothetical protein EV44_g6253 [Erysiphe necator]